MRTIILPDIHGRQFWKDVELHDGDEIIFLGDYLDPYGYEGITPKMALENFKELLDFVEKNKERVTMLIGNHDCSYIFPHFSKCRFDRENREEISALFEDCKGFLKLTCERCANGKRFIFSHAALLKPWLERHDDIITQVNEDEINAILKRADCGQLLDEVSFYRGGYESVGSIVWADVRECDSQNMVDGIINVFGHTQLNTKPVVIDKRYVCLDLRRPFILTQEGEITELDGTKILTNDDKDKQKA